MKLERFEVPGLAHYSYILESRGQAVVIDPKRDFDTYIRSAAARGLKISKVLETHIHADFASGARQLAAATSAELWLSFYDRGEDFEYRFPHCELRDGSEIAVGDLNLIALHTPGHTPEHLSFLVADTARCRCPMALLSGDFVFVGSLGRPDLLGESAKLRLAAELYESLHQRIGRLPDGIEIYPAHGAGSMCGSGMAERQQSTLGYERACNPFFSDRDKQSFIHHILSTVPPFPDYYRRMKRVNSEGPALLEQLPGGHGFSPAEFRQAMQDGNALVIDLRCPEAFGTAHIPGSFNIGAGKDLSTWAAWVVPYDRPVLLVSDDGTDQEEARRSLIRVGFDDIRGCLRGGMKTWIDAGYEQEHVPQVSVGGLHQRLGRGARVLDVRNEGEWNAGHIAGAQHIMAGDLPKRVAEVPADTAVYVICGSGYRSSVAASVLRRAGLRDLVNVAGGMAAWNNAGLPTVR